MADKTGASRERYEKLLEQVQRLQKEGKLSTQPSDEQRADWAYGNTALSNPDVTLDMARKAVEEHYATYRGERVYYAPRKGM